MEGQSAAEQNAEGLASEEEKGAPDPKLAEVRKLLPYYMLSLDYDIAVQATKCLQKMMVMGDLSVRIALVDQMIYFIKELMLESPEEHLVTQCLQTLTNMITIWHQSEKIKFQATTNQEIRPGHKLANYTVFDLVSAGGESLQTSALDDASKHMYKELHHNQQMFDLIDMLSVLGLCSKDIFARSLSCILIQETGKLRRLLIRKEKQRHVLADLLYYNRDQMIDALVGRVSIFYGLKGQGFKSQPELRQVLERLQFYQFIVDNFEYQRFGLWESLVRDIQVLYIGDLARMWKETLLKHTKVAGVILHYIQHLSSTALALFESRQGGVQADSSTQVSSAQRDHVGFNLLLAIVLCNVTKSHELRNRQPLSQKDNQELFVDDSSEDMTEVFSSGKLTTNTIMEEASALIGHTETNFNHMHKISFTTFYPARLWTSNILLSFLFYLQEPLDQKSMRNLNEIFIVKRLDFQPGDSKQQQFVENCLIFFTLLMASPNQMFTSYVVEQLEEETRRQEEQVSNAIADDNSEAVDDIAGGNPLSKSLAEMCAIFVNTLETVEMTDDAQGMKKFVLRISMAHSICTCIQQLREHTSNRVQSTDYLSRDQQISLLQETRAQFNNVSKSAEQQWLCPMLKQIWFCLISFEAIIGGNLDLLDDGDPTRSKQPKLIIPAKLIDLKFLIQLEQDGFTGALKYYKFFHLIQVDSGSNNPRQTTSNDAARINEIKLLIQHVYAFFGSKRQSQRPQLPDQPLKSDLSQISGFSADVSYYSRYPEQPVKVQKNVYFKCLVNCVIDTIALCKALESLKAIVGSQAEEAEGTDASSKPLFANSAFAPVYQTLANCIFKQSKANLESRLGKFCKSNLHSKIFLVSLFVSLNSTDKMFIEKARILSLSILPLMFPDLVYRKIVEDKIIAHAMTSQIKQLISHENKHFYQFIKRVFMGEERFNMEHHFEKYFSLSGFLRDILNEIIKLQAAESDQPQITPKMLLKVLDIVTYFFSGNIDLRRAPQMPQAAQAQMKGSQQMMAENQPQQSSDTFIFAHLIDYKSFEFLSKLYKISEKLVDHDTDLLVMNMWYKVVENRPANFEILTKFLIHNLSSFIMKLRATSTKETSLNQSMAQSQQGEDSYGIEYEKQKRYSLSIFNYVKARTQQIDIRNSLNVDSVCSWSQKMLKVVIRAQLNLHSKYSLEKMKLKQILQNLHAEINQSGFEGGIGGLDALTSLMVGGNEGEDDGRELHKPPARRANDDMTKSVSMSVLLESRTFVRTFGGGKTNRDKARKKQLLFVIERQMSEKFDELTPDNQIMQLPDLVIKYYENALIMIANESERLQIIKYSLKEELTITSIIVLLMGDLATRQCEINRFYFMYDLLNKLTLNIPGIQRYLKLHMLSMEQFQSITSEEEVLAVFNYRSVLDHFGTFTNIFFQLLHNTVAIPKLQKFLLHLWWLCFDRIQVLISKGEGEQRLRDSVMGCQPPHFTRATKDSPAFDLHEMANGSRTVGIHGLLTMLKGCFFSLHQYSIKSLRARENSNVISTGDLRNIMQNFIAQVKCVMEYILPAQLKPLTMRDFSDPYAPEISFATNAAFWLSYACLEASSIAASTTPIEDAADLNDTISSQVTTMRQSIAAVETGSSSQLETHLMEQIQELGMSTMRRILEESDFLKLLIGIQKLSSHFFSYSLSIQAGKTALLPLLFVALENHSSCEDAYKSLIVTIRIQDSHLLMVNSDESARAEAELHRFLLLVPFFHQQFLGFEQGQAGAKSSYFDDQKFPKKELKANKSALRRSTIIFTNKKSIIQLLKKSLLSVGIDKKKEILNILDEIQLEVDQADPRVIRELFGRLVKATCEICVAQNCQQILHEALKTFQAIATNVTAAKDPLVVIESEIMQQTIRQVREVLNEMENTEIEINENLCLKQAAELYSCQDRDQKMLGEELAFIKREIRPLYFGLKNIICHEIRALDTQINVRAFFIEEETAGFPNDAVLRQRSHYAQGTGQKLSDIALSDAISDIASTSQQAPSAPPAGYPSQTVRIKKHSQQKKEMISKYQNSANALNVSPPHLKTQQSSKVVTVSNQFLQQQPLSVGFGASVDPSSMAKQIDRQFEINSAAATSQANQGIEQENVAAQHQTDIEGISNSQSEDQAYTYSQTTAIANTAVGARSQQTLQTAVRHGTPAVEPDAQLDVSRRSSKIYLDEEERKIQQEQLSQILFENEEEEEKAADDLPRSKIDIMLEPARLAAKSFAESVLAEELKQSQQGPLPHDFHPRPEFNVASETSHEIDGLLGTFAKPAVQAKTREQVVNRVDEPSLHLSQKHALMRGEVPIDKEFDFSQVMSSIGAHQTDRDKAGANFTADKQRQQDDDKFGTGDFPDVDQLAKLRDQQRFHTVNRQNFRQAMGQPDLADDAAAEQVRLSQLGARTRDERLQTQKFDSRKDFGNQAATANDEGRMRTAAAGAPHVVVPPLKTGLMTQQQQPNATDIMTKKKQYAMDALLRDIMLDEEEFYELESFLGDEKNYDVDSLAFYVKVMEFKKETNALNSTLAAGMIIDNYLTEDAQYYIGNEVQSDDMISRLIGGYELVVTQQLEVPLDLFDGVCEQIVQKLLPFVMEFKARGRIVGAGGQANASDSGFSNQGY